MRLSLLILLCRCGTLQGRLIYDHPTSVAAGMGTMSPQKRGAQNREKKGVVKGTIRTIIDNSPEALAGEKSEKWPKPCLV